MEGTCDCGPSTAHFEFVVKRKKRKQCFMYYIMYKVLTESTSVQYETGGMRGSRKFFQRGFKFDNFLLVDKGIEDPNTAINGPSSARLRNAIEMAFRWRADDGPTFNAGLVAL